MSYDFATERVCSHRIGPERVFLNSNDSTFFDLSKTPASDSATVQIDGQNVPKSGLYTRAQVVFSNPEPYRLQSGKSDLLTVRVGQDTPRTVTLPPGNSVRAADIARVLSDAVPELNFDVVNKRVIARTHTTFKGAAFSFPDPRWTDKAESLISTSRILGAMKQLGITPGRVGSGVKVFPGWKITVNPVSYYDQFIILFDEPIPNDSPVVTVIYQTVAQLCNRCGGTRLEYDYTVSKQSYETVQATDLLAQEVDKFMFTRIGSHWKWKWMGSGLSDRIGGKAETGLGSAAGLVSMDVSQAFATYQNIKQQQARSFPQQDVTDAEFPYSLDGLTAASPSDDPTTIVVNMVIRNRSRDYIPLTRIVNAPDPFQLTSDPSGMLKSVGSGFKIKG